MGRWPLGAPGQLLRLGRRPLGSALSLDDDIAQLESNIEELEQEGDSDNAPTIATWMAELGSLYVEREEDDRAHALWEEALIRIDVRQDPTGWLAAARVWEERCYYREGRDDKPGLADAAGEAYRLVRRALPLVPAGVQRDDAIELGLYMANQVGSYHFDRDPKMAMRMWNEALALREANPHLPPTRTHARLYMNRGLYQHDIDATPAARESYQRAIALYNDVLDDDPLTRFELARCWRQIGALADTDQGYEEATATALSLYELDPERVENLHDIAAMHNDRGVALRKQGRFAEAVAHQSRAMIAFVRVVRLDPTPENKAIQAAYHGALALALGGAGNLDAALGEARTAIADLERLITDDTDPFADSILQKLRNEVKAWGPERALGHELSCSFCYRKRREVKKLISGPHVFICDSCVGLSLDIIEKDWPLDPATKVRAGTPKRNSRGTRCAFCDFDVRRAFIQGPTIAICDDCIDLCVDIIEEELGAKADP